MVEVFIFQVSMSLYDIVTSILDDGGAPFVGRFDHYIFVGGDHLLLLFFILRDFISENGPILGPSTLSWSRLLK